MSESPYFGPGTTPDRVAEAIREAREDREHRPRPRPSTSEREAFFGRIAEDIKRAEAGR
jgi:hypothetical protein